MKQQTDTNHKLKRNLNNRHIQLIAIGGCIGTGLFMGAGKTIVLAGPSILMIYLIIGAVLFLMMRALGEILLSNLQYKSFLDFVSELIGPCAGFFLGWSYWLCWVTIGIADLVAISGYTQMFFPHFPAWISALFCIAIFYISNRLTVKLFGEVEFWFAIIKIIAICVLIIVGIILLGSHFKSPSGDITSIKNIWNHGNLFPNGLSGFLSGFQIAAFAFIGVELVGTTAAESKDPYKTLPKAINNIPLRILLFYIFSIMVIMVVIPYSSIDPTKSPFIVLFRFAGFPIAAGVVYFVVMTSAASSTNSGIFSSSRMLFGLALLKKAPRFFAKLSKSSVPANGLMFSCICLLSAVILLYFNDKRIMEVFTLVTSVATIIFLFTWFLILLSYIFYCRKYPQRHLNSFYKLPGGILSCGVGFLFIIFVLMTLAIKPDTRPALYVGLGWFMLLGVSYLFVPNSVKSCWRQIVDNAVNAKEEKHI